MNVPGSLPDKKNIEPQHMDGAARPTVTAKLFELTRRYLSAPACTDSSCAITNCARAIAANRDEL